MLAIMGASGSGKTTLLDALSLRTKLKVHGVLKVNGHPVTSIKQLSFISAYVLQEDLFFDTLTVHEHLTFHVKLFILLEVISK
jgi:ABC-type multidrug transport system ATPase subunit